MILIRIFKAASRLGTVLLALGISTASAQDRTDSIPSRNILFTEPLRFFVGDFPIGFEHRYRENRSWNIIVDFQKSLVSEKKINTTPRELLLYDGIGVRAGIKHLRPKGHFRELEYYYKFSGYNNRLILRDNHEGEQFDVYYNESRRCHSLGADFKFGKERLRDTRYFCYFISIGARLRIDNVTVNGKQGFYGEPEGEVSSSIEFKPIPILRAGIAMGIFLTKPGTVSPDWDY